MTKYFTDDDLRDQLRERILQRGDLQALADDIGTQISHLSPIVNGKRSISAKVAAYLGYEVVIQRQRLYQKARTK